MQNRVTATKNGKQITEKIDYLRRVTTALLNEVKSLSSLKSVEIEKGIDLEEVVQKFEIQLIERALEETDGNQKRAAQLLSLKYTTLCAKVKRYNIQIEDRGTSSDSSGEQVKSGNGNAAEISR